MVGVAALTLAEATSRIDAIAAAASTVPLSKSDLLAACDVLLGATAAQDAAPVALLDIAAHCLAGAEPAVVESLPPLARVAVRLLRLGHSDAAWPVLVDGASGVVQRTFNATTSSGADRADWQLPLLTTIESKRVYAELPGFRDPRYRVPDDVYDISTAIKLRCHVDDVATGRRPLIAGWAALDVLSTEPDETVAVVAVLEKEEVRWPALRCRRADLVGGSRGTLRRRAWAGWRAEITPQDLTGDARWALWLEVGQRGMARRARLGKSVSELAAHAVGGTFSDRPSTMLIDGAGGWSLARGSASL